MTDKQIEIIRDIEYNSFDADEFLIRVVRIASKYMYIKKEGEEKIDYNF